MLLYLQVCLSRDTNETSEIVLRRMLAGHVKILRNVHPADPKYAQSRMLPTGPAAEVHLRPGPVMKFNACHQVYA
jgi:hypothetical protein